MTHTVLSSLLTLAMIVPAHSGNSINKVEPTLASYKVLPSPNVVEIAQAPSKQGEDDDEPIVPPN